MRPGSVRSNGHTCDLPLPSPPFSDRERSTPGPERPSAQHAARPAAVRGVVLVRDSRQPDGAVLDLSADAFPAFVAGVKAGALGAV
ncbi:DUF397 domain-containing protein [Streptomyces sp. JJ38]|nr:DUF397 domain-containing protein [Streptomyces sp. JJ38]